MEKRGGIQTTLGWSVGYPVWYPTENRILEVVSAEKEISLPELAKKTGRSKSWVYRILKKNSDKLSLSKESTIERGQCRQRLVVRAIT